MRLAYALTATDMRMRENDVTLGIPKTSYYNNKKHVRSAKAQISFLEADFDWSLRLTTSGRREKKSHKSNRI